MRLQQHRNIEVGGATLECTLYGSGTPVVLLANAGCSTGYFDDLARVLAAGGLQAICVNMRGTGESRGSLDGITVHDLAADVAGVLEALDCGPAHLVGWSDGGIVSTFLPFRSSRLFTASVSNTISWPAMFTRSLTRRASMRRAM